MKNQKWSLIRWRYCYLFRNCERIHVESSKTLENISLIETTVANWFLSISLTSIPKDTCMAVYELNVLNILSVSGTYNSIISYANDAYPPSLRFTKFCFYEYIFIDGTTRLFTDICILARVSRFRFSMRQRPTPVFSFHHILLVTSATLFNYIRIATKWS